MDGTLLALIAVILLVHLVLLALDRRGKPEEAAPKQKGRSERFVTHEQLEERLEEEAKRMQWANEEWHEKFSTLHARLAKRVKRSEKPEPEVEEEEQPELSPVLARRRLGSV